MATKQKHDTLPAAEAKSGFADALRRAEGGEVVVITRYGRPVAALISADDLAAVRRLRAATPLDGLAGLAGRWRDGDELADEVEKVVALRARTPSRPVPEFD